jgi:beta-lactamase regulating signal transducer with metallopeptidase domain
VADEFTELILSFALIFFIIFIFKAKTETNTRSLYTFAWLMVSFSLIIPATYAIPRFICIRAN